MKLGKKDIDEKKCFKKGSNNWWDWIYWISLSKFLKEKKI